MPRKSSDSNINHPTPPAEEDSLQKRSTEPRASGADLTELIRNLSIAGGVPINLMPATAPLIDTAARLNQKKAVPVAFPPCAEELLALIKTTGVPDTDKDDLTKYFDEYFKFGQQHRIIEGNLDEHLDSKLLECLRGGVIFRATNDVGASSGNGGWPTDCCFCSPCVTLDGNRNAAPLPLPNQPVIPGPLPVIPSLKRLFIGDLVWLFYFERMGIFQILGVILDAFASNGRLPISNGAINQPPGIKDDIVAVVLEVMIRQIKMGMSSTVRERGCSYQTALGWTSAPARKLSLDTQVNTGFTQLFHKLITNVIPFNDAKRMAVAIRGTAAPAAPPSVATLITISDTLDVLKKRFEAFDYNRNYYHTLSGIVWAISTMSVIRELRTTLGIPPAFNDPHEYIPAAYDLLVLKRPVTSGDTNRYLVHKEAARNARDILLDIEVINHQDNKPGGELENWLTQIEAKVEGYRTAYRTLTGVDIGASVTPAIEQQV